MLIHFAHANGIPAASYSPLYKKLAPHQVIYKPQFGHDSNYPYTDNWQHLADELIDFLSLNSKQPLLAVGHSLGAIVSFIAACKKPELFTGVLMLDPPLVWGKLAWMFRLAKLTGQTDKITPAGKSKFRKQHWSNRQQAIEYFGSKRLFQFQEDCFTAFCDAALKNSINESVELAFDVEVEVGIFRNTPHNLRRYRRPELLPMKVVYGLQSDASQAQSIEPFCKYFDITSQTITGEHMYPLQQPDFTVDIIKQFIREIEHAD
jgi:pimeloyl-ACP methyl ester carboxylesterase